MSFWSLCAFFLCCFIAQNMFCSLLHCCGVFCFCSLSKFSWSASVSYVPMRQLSRCNKSNLAFICSCREWTRERNLFHVFFSLLHKFEETLQAMLRQHIWQLLASFLCWQAAFLFSFRVVEFCDVQQQSEPTSNRRVAGVDAFVGC